METVRDFILGSSKITADGDYSHEVKRHLLLGRKATTHRGWSHHQILCLPTGQHGQLNNREPGPSNAWCTELHPEPHPGCPFKSLTRQSTERTPARGCPSMCLMHGTTEKDPRQGSPLSAWMGVGTEKDWPKRPSDHQLQEARKDSDRAITSVAEAVRVPAHLVPPGSPQTKQLSHLHTQLSLGSSCHRPKKKSCIYEHRVTSVMSNPVNCGLPGFPIRGLLQVRTLERTGQYWFPYPSRSLYFLLP